MKVTLTGGAGFIGSHVLDALLDDGHEVVVVDNGRRPHRDDVEHMSVAITDLGSMREAVRGSDFVFHLAAVSDVNVAFDDPLGCIESNIKGTGTVLEASRLEKVGRVIFASTVWIYSGSRGDEVHEDSPFFIPDAGHVYTSSKIACELLFHDYQKLYGLPFTVLRYGIPYGPRMRDTLVIPIFIKKALRGEPMTVMGDGQQHRNFVFVRDLARAHLLAMGGAAENQIFNLEGREQITVRQVAETIERFVGETASIDWVPARPGDYGGKTVSAAKAENELGWRADVTFEVGMQETVDWFRSNSDAK